MSRIDGTRVGTEPQDLDETAATAGTTGETRGEPQATEAERGDRLEAFAGSTRNRERAFRELNELREPAEQLRSAFEHLSDVEGAERGRARKALGKIGSGLCRCAEWTGNIAQGARIRETTSRVDRAFDNYQRQPNAQNARELKAAMTAWNEAIGPVAGRVPLPHVAASLSGMIEAGSMAIGNFAVLVTDRAERAMAASMEDPPSQTPTPATAPAAAPVVAPPPPAPPPSFEALPDVVRERVQARAATAGQKQVPARLERSIDRFEAAHAQLSRAHAETASRWLPFGRDALEERERKLGNEMRAALMQLDVDVNANLGTGYALFSDLVDCMPGH